jgi:hypothetical protein
MNEEAQRDHVCFGFECWGCEEPLLMAFDTYDGRAPFRFNGTGTIIVSCKGCGERHAYRREEFRRFVVRPGAPSVVAMPLGDAAANELR